IDTMEREKYIISAEFIFKNRNFYYGAGGGFMCKNLNFKYDTENILDYSKYNDYSSWFPLILKFSYLNRDYICLKNIDNYNRKEDIPIGWTISGNIGYNLYNYHNDNMIDNVLYGVNFSSAIMKLGYAGLSLDFQRKYDYCIFDAKARYFFPNNSEVKYRFGFGIDYIALRVDNMDRQLIADGRSGFRGFPAYYQVGTPDENQHFLKMSAQFRLFPDYELLTIRPGFTIFADFGGAQWKDYSNLRNRYSDINTHNNWGWMCDFGISIQLCSTRSSTGNINRFDISYNPQTKTIGFTIDSGRALNFFLPMTISPFLNE
ncbi:hypothetical protein DRQ33_04230, partial [bacterium]